MGDRDVEKRVGKLVGSKSLGWPVFCFGTWVGEVLGGTMSGVVRDGKGVGASVGWPLGVPDCCSVGRLVGIVLGLEVGFDD